MARRLDTLQFPLVTKAIANSKIHSAMNEAEKCGGRRGVLYHWRLQGPSQELLLMKSVASVSKQLKQRRSRPKNLLSSVLYIVFIV